MNSTPECAENRSGTDQGRLRMLRQVERDAPSCLGAFRKAYSSKSRGAAVKAFCLECLWMDRQAIRDCAAAACPLWNVRPFRQRRRGKDASPATGTTQ